MKSSLSSLHQIEASLHQRLPAIRLFSTTASAPALSTAAYRRPVPPRQQPPAASCRRTFYASKPLFHQHDAPVSRGVEQYDEASRLASKSDAATTAETGPKDAKKAAEKKRRKQPLKTSLRRVAIVAQKGASPESSSAATHARPDASKSSGISTGSTGSTSTATSTTASTGTGTSSPKPAAGLASSPATSTGAAADDTTAAAMEAAAQDGRSAVSAVCVAEAFDMDKVVSILSSHNFALDPDRTGFESSEVVHARALNGGDIFVFPSGSVVTWGIPSETAEDLAARHLLPAAESSTSSYPFSISPEEKEVEDMSFVTDPAQDASRVAGDVVLLGTQREVDSGVCLSTTLAKIAFSSGLARSTKLAVLETLLTRYLESTRDIPSQLLSLSGGGGIVPAATPLSRSLILRNTAELLALRGQLNHYNDLTDALPDLFWDSEEQLETYYSKIGRALDVGVRIKTLNDKMTYAQEVIDAAQAVLEIGEKVSSEKHSTRLEWIIIILIAIEVAFGLRHLYIEQFSSFQADVLAELEAIKAALGGSGNAPGSKAAEAQTDKP